MATAEILAILFGLVAPIGVVAGGVNRYQLKRGIGAQFIRYIALVVALPAAASLAFLGLLTEAMVSIISGALAYLFAGFSKDEG